MLCVTYTLRTWLEYSRNPEGSNTLFYRNEEMFYFGFNISSTTIVTVLNLKVSPLFIIDSCEFLSVHIYDLSGLLHERGNTECKQIIFFPEKCRHRMSSWTGPFPTSNYPIHYSEITPKIRSNIF